MKQMILALIIVTTLLSGCALYQSTRYSLVEQGVNSLVDDGKLTEAQKEDILYCVSNNTTLISAGKALSADSRNALLKAGFNSLSDLAQDQLNKD